MQSHVDFAVFQLFDIVMKRSDIVRKWLFFMIGNLFIQFGFHCQFTNRLLHGRNVAPIFLESSILIDRFLKLGDFIIGTCIGDRRRHVTHKAGRSTPLGDHTFASDRHMVWIDIRDVPERNVRIAFFIKSDTFPRKPLKISMRPHMNDSIRFPHVTQPVVESEILMRRRDLRVVIRLRRIHPILTRWLYRKEKMSIHRTRDENIAFFRNHDIARCLSPGIHHGRLRFFPQLSEEIQILAAGKLLAGLRLLFGHHGNVIRRMRCHEPYEIIRCFRDEIHLIARFLHFLHETDGTLHRIQTGSTPNIRILRRIIMENDSDLFIFILHLMKSCPFPRLFDHMRHALRNRHIGDTAIDIFFSTCDRQTGNRAVQLRKRDRDRRFHRIHALWILAPVSLRCEKRIGREDRHS